MSMDITASITGNVWKILVKVGDEVEEDDEVAILESMKMEIPIESPDDGTITAIRVAEGDAVNEGVVLMVVE
jgi:acetyl-CoA carboxylase biotin carboxyl carrier protein